MIDSILSYFYLIGRNRLFISLVASYVISGSLDIYVEKNQPIKSEIMNIKKVTFDWHESLVNRALSKCAAFRFHPQNVRNFDVVWLLIVDWFKASSSIELSIVEELRSLVVTTERNNDSGECEFDGDWRRELSVL